MSPETVNITDMERAPDRAMFSESEQLLMSPKRAGSGSGLVADCRRMLSYARKNGFRLPQELVTDIALLDALLKEKGMEPVSEIDMGLVSSGLPSTVPYTTDSAGTGPSAMQRPGELQVLTVHQALSDVIAPATALTLLVSEPPPGRHRLLGGMPLLVKSAAVIALTSALIFMVTSQVLASKGLGTGRSQTTPSGERR
jgi:hypothetical protein